ncbi:MAG TPA: site-specific recombinase [Streptosporangiaceae bacterium]|jgi:integrase/recombinase XerD|nr:site-specific recombinase [Streptosporangiaceae bacterium]
MSVAPVEYAVAVGRYLDSANLTQGSRRIYRISLTSWAWPLVGQPMPVGRNRRGAAPPVVALAELDAPDIRARLATAVAERAGDTDARTVNRELSALRSAVGWWQDQGWIRGDPTASLRHMSSALQPLPPQPLTERQLAALWRSDACLREHALWRLLYDSAAPAIAVLALDASDLDLEGCRARGSAAAAPVTWTTGTSELLGWLLAGRRHGPVFLTERRAPSRAAGSDICPMTSRARMSYRRAAEIFTAHTAALDSAGRGWTLHQLRRPGQPRRPSMASSLI